jgi:hypothetical protein
MNRVDRMRAMVIDFTYLDDIKFEIFIIFTFQYIQLNKLIDLKIPIIVEKMIL